VVKIWQLIGGLLAARALCHGTTGTIVNPALAAAALAASIGCFENFSGSSGFYIFS